MLIPCIMTKVPCAALFSLSLFALVFSFFQRTQLFLGWDGLPLNSKFEAGTLLFLILFLATGAIAILACRLRSGAPASRKTVTQLSLVLLLSSTALIALKVRFPPVSYFQPCIVSPHLETTAKPIIKKGCTYNAEPFREIAFDESKGKPWRLAFLNTLAFNYYDCSKEDLQCQDLMKWREARSDPFEMIYQLPVNAWPSSGAALSYAGQVQISQLVKGIKKVIRLPFSRDLNQHDFIVPKESDGPIEIHYRNYQCKNSSLDFSSERNCIHNEDFESLRTSSAKLIIPLSSPSHLWVYLGEGLILLCLTSLLLLLRVVLKAFPTILPEFPVVLSKKSTLIPLAVILGSFCYLVPESARNKTLPTLMLAGILIVRFNSEIKVRMSRLKTTEFTPFLALAVAWILKTLSQMPMADTQEYYSPGHDWLSYSSLAYEILEAPALFLHPHMVFSKPFFIYFRAALAVIFGNGTLYLSLFAQFLFGLLFIFSYYQFYLAHKRRPLALSTPITLLLFCYVSFFLVFYLQHFVLAHPAGLSEIPMWLLAILGIQLIFTLNLNSRADWDKPTLYTILLVLNLAYLMRTYALFPILFVPIFLGFLRPDLKSPLPVFLLSLAVSTGLILVHAFPVWSQHFTDLLTYMKWQFLGTGAEKHSIDFWWGYDRVFYDAWLKPIYLLFIVLILERTWRLKIYAKGFGTLFAMVVFLFLPYVYIVDPAYFPRHNILSSFTVCITCCALILFDPPIDSFERWGRSLFARGESPVGKSV